MHKIDLSPSVSKKVKWVFSHKHTNFSKFSPIVHWKKCPLVQCLKSRSQAGVVLDLFYFPQGGESINVTSLKITTIFFPTDGQLAL